MTRIFEDDIEQWMVEALKDQGFTYISPDKLDPDKSTDLRVSYHEVAIESYLASALQRINLGLSSSILSQAVKEVLRIPSTGDLITANQNFHKLLTEGVDVTFVEKSEERTVKAKLLDEHNPANNHWCVTHQVTVIENGQQKYYV